MLRELVRDLGAAGVAELLPGGSVYISHVLDPCGVPPRMLRCTRLAGLVNTMDPKLVAAAFGMHPEGVMIYLADHVDELRLAAARQTWHLRAGSWRSLLRRGLPHPHSCGFGPTAASGELRARAAGAVARG